MKKVLAIVLMLVLGLGFAVLGNQAKIGDLVLQDYCIRWNGLNVPLISFTGKTCQIADEPFPVVINGLSYGQRTWLYAFLGDQLIYVKLVTNNGITQIIVPSLYNNGQWQPGWQTLTLVLSSAPRFNIEDGRRPQTITAKNFIGYPCAGYVMVRQITFYAYACSPCWCAPCWCGKDP